MGGCAKFLSIFIALFTTYVNGYSAPVQDPRMPIHVAQFHCGGRHVPESWRCNGIRNCENGEDEICEMFDCNVNEQETTGSAGQNGEQVYLSQKCDGKNDCSNGADELNCEELIFTCSGRTNDDGNHDEHEYTYDIPIQWRCDGFVDCVDDWSDEEGCPEFQCDSGMKIETAKWCDSFYDCDDKSDEKGCPLLICDRPAGQTQGGRYVKLTELCQAGKEPVCQDKTDATTCMFFRCSADNHTIPSDWTCDLFPDCPDGEDELLNCPTHTCPPQKVPRAQVCDGKVQCDDESDEFDCPVFMCDDGEVLLNQKGVCNGTAECTDRTDEQLSSCFLFCGEDTSQTFHKRNLCDGAFSCTNGFDERDCGDFACINQLPMSWVCDGIPDCSDQSDEAMCPEQPPVQPNVY